MLKSVVSKPGNLKENRKDKLYRVDYLDPEPDIEGWHEFSNPAPEVGATQSFWYRLASAKRRVTVTYKMEILLSYIPGRYRIETFVPAKHATVTKASFAVTDCLDEQGKPVEHVVTINMNQAKNEWVSLGEFDLDVKQKSIIGQVRQFDDTDENLKTPQGKPREITFGPVRWVPLYQTADPVYAPLGDPKYSQICYLDPGQASLLEAQWSNRQVWDFGDTRSEWAIKHRRRSKTRQLQVDFRMPDEAVAGKYRIEAFIPAISPHSTQTIYKIKTEMQLVNGEKIYPEKTVIVNQSSYANQWASLGEYELIPDPQPDPVSGSLVGQVSQFDDTGDLKNLIISFGPIRWVPRFQLEIKSGDQFDFPVGTPGERSALIERNQFGKFSGLPRWLKTWYDATPFLTPYEHGIHTGADLNLAGFEDLNQPVFAAGYGKVTFAGPAGGLWAYIIVIEHPVAWVRLPDGRKEQRKVYTRYGHVSKESLGLVKEGDEVERGAHIGYIGYMTGFKDRAHLHFDVSHTETLLHRPSHWPNMSAVLKAQPKSDEFKKAVLKTQEIVRQDYLDPFEFLIDNHNL